MTYEELEKACDEMHAAAVESDGVFFCPYLMELGRGVTREEYARHREFKQLAAMRKMIDASNATLNELLKHRPKETE
jgi:hypothetical protein